MTQLPFDDGHRRRIYLLRHGHALGESEKSARYTPDISLTEQGVRDAEAARDFLARIPLDEAWSSDMARARQTAEIILGRHSLPLSTSSAYREFEVDLRLALHTGELSMDDRIRAFAYQLWRPDIEDAHMLDVGERFRPYFDGVHATMDSLALGATGKSLLLVAHDGFNRAALCWAVGAPMTAMASFEQDLCCVNVLDVDIDAANTRILRRYVRLANFSPSDPEKANLHLTDFEASARKVAELLGNTGKN